MSFHEKICEVTFKPHLAQVNLQFFPETSNLSYDLVMQLGFSQICSTFLSSQKRFLTNLLSFYFCYLDFAQKTEYNYFKMQILFLLKSRLSSHAFQACFVNVKNKSRHAQNIFKIWKDFFCLWVSDIFYQGFFGEKFHNVEKIVTAQIFIYVKSILRILGVQKLPFLQF